MRKFTLSEWILIILLGGLSIASTAWGIMVIIQKEFQIVGIASIILGLFMAFYTGIMVDSFGYQHFIEGVFHGKD